MIKKLTLKHLIWLLPFIYIVHNLEEWLTMQTWLGNHPSTINLLLKEQLPAWFWQNFNIVRGTALIVASVLPFGLYLIINNLYKKKYPTYILTVTAWIIVINSAQHIGMTLLLRTYTPGVVSAAFINLPFSLVLLNFIQNNQDWVLPKKAKWFAISIFAYPVLMLFIWLLAMVCVKLIS